MDPFIYTPPQEPLTIIHQDDDLLVLSKPSGLLSVPGKDPNHADCLEARAKKQFPSALTVHRLDMATSGIVVIAMNPEAQANLGKQFERRKVSKTYIARVWGQPSENEGLIDLPLRCDWPNRPKQMVCHDQGRAAQTHWRVIEREENAARMELKPITGRSHQLRVHMLELGHPILGDEFYAHNAALNAADCLQLHASEISLHHPKDGQLITFNDPCPF